MKIYQKILKVRRRCSWCTNFVEAGEVSFRTVATGSGHEACINRALELSTGGRAGAAGRSVDGRVIRSSKSLS